MTDAKRYTPKQDNCPICGHYMTIFTDVESGDVIQMCRTCETPTLILPARKDSQLHDAAARVLRDAVYTVDSVDAVVPNLLIGRLGATLLQACGKTWKEILKK